MPSKKVPIVAKPDPNKLYRGLCPVVRRHPDWFGPVVPAASNG